MYAVPALHLHPHLHIPQESSSRTAAHSDTTTATTPVCAAAPPIVGAAPFLPGDPSALQSRHAAYISTTNAWPSGLCSPCAPTLYGFTTGWSHPSDVKCTRLLLLLAGAVAVAEDMGAVLVLVDVLVEVELSEEEGDADTEAGGDDDEAAAEEAEEEKEEEAEVELLGAESAARHCSARGRCVWTPARSARR